MKKILLLVLLSACNSWKTVPGPVQSESGIVDDVLFQPSRHGAGTGVGITMNGDLAVSSVNVDLPDKRTVVFRCEHGRFALEGDHNKLANQLWSKLDKGDHVLITYRELHDGDGKFIKYETLSVEKQAGEF